VIGGDFVAIGSEVKTIVKKIFEKDPVADNLVTNNENIITTSPEISSFVQSPPTTPEAIS